MKVLDKLQINKNGTERRINLLLQVEKSENKENREGCNRRKSQNCMIYIWKHQKLIPIVTVNRVRQIAKQIDMLYKWRDK